MATSHAPSAGSYVIHSAKWKSLVITLTHSSTVVGFHQSEHPSNAQKWKVGSITENGNNWTTLQNVANKKYLAWNGGIVTTETPYGWLIISDGTRPDRYRIHQWQSRKADIALTDSSTLGLEEFDFANDQFWWDFKRC